MTTQTVCVTSNTIPLQITSGTIETVRNGGRINYKHVRFALRNVRDKKRFIFL